MSNDELGLEERGKPMDPYAVPCPECHHVFTCEFIMQSHQMSHWPQPHAFIDLALNCPT